jgi:hypothetical protein
MQAARLGAGATIPEHITRCDQTEIVWSLRCTVPRKRMLSVTIDHDGEDVLKMLPVLPGLRGALSANSGHNRLLPRQMVAAVGSGAFGKSANWATCSD